MDVNPTIGTQTIFSGAPAELRDTASRTDNRVPGTSIYDSRIFHSAAEIRDTASSTDNRVPGTYIYDSRIFHSAANSFLSSIGWDGARVG